LKSPTEKQSRVIWLALTGLAIAMLIALVVALVWGLGHVLRILSPVLWPLAIAVVIVYLLDPVVDHFEKKGLSRVVSIICVFGIALLLVAALFASIVPQIVSEARQFVSHVPEYSAKLEQRVEHWIENPPPLIQKFLKHAAAPSETPATTSGEIDSSATTNAVTSATTTSKPANLGGAIDQNTLQSAKDWLAKVLPGIGSWLGGQAKRLASWLGFLAGMALVPVYAFYLLLERRGIESSWTEYLPVSDSKFKDELVFVLRAINGYLIAFFRGQVLVAMCDAVLYTIGFLIIGLPYAVLIGAAALVLTMIPFLGAITLCVTALVIAVVQYGDWLHPLLVLVVFAVVQSLEGLVISPRIMGGRVGLHPLAIIIAVMAGTTLLGGLLGGVLAIPLTAVLRVLLARYVWKKREV
jgi:predicted PurR-regulated permease PerM